jgi:hypothetical protein
MNDSALFRAFDLCLLPAAQLDHRLHVRLAFLYLKQAADFATGAARFRDALRQYTEVHGVQEKFHETLTWTWLALVNEAMDGHRDADSEAFVARVPGLLDGRAALASVGGLEAILADPRARRVFVLPRSAR